jgi:PhnB protein
MKVTPYLHFKGNCREAFAYYADTFRGRIASSLTFAESPFAAQTPAEMKNWIMHERLEFGDNAIQGSDAPPDRYRAPQGFSVSVLLEDPDEGERIFRRLADNGSVDMPYAQTFFAHRFGMCTDRFGQSWMIHVDKAPG